MHLDDIRTVNETRTELVPRPYYLEFTPAALGGAPLSHPLRLELKTTADSPAYILHFTPSEVKDLLTVLSAGKVGHRTKKNE